MSDTNAFAQIADELKLQAWLARAEFKNPSADKAHREGEISALARTRDELRLQLHLGKLNAGDEWDALENSWRKFMHQAEDAAEDVGKNVQELLEDIREGYEKLVD